MIYHHLATTLVKRVTNNTIAVNIAVNNNDPSDSLSFSNNSSAESNRPWSNNNNNTVTAYFGLVDASGDPVIDQQQQEAVRDLENGLEINTNDNPSDSSNSSSNDNNPSDSSNVHSGNRSDGTMSDINNTNDITNKGFVDVPESKRGSKESLKAIDKKEVREEEEEREEEASDDDKEENTLSASKSGVVHSQSSCPSKGSNTKLKSIKALSKNQYPRFIKCHCMILLHLLR